MSDVPQFQAILLAIVEFRIEPMQRIAQVRGHLTGQIAQVRGELVQTRADIMERIDGLRNQVTIIGRRFLGDLLSLEPHREESLSGG